jgi:hypothetical protein
VSSHYAPQFLIEWAAALVDRSGLLEKLSGWEKEDEKYRGGRPASLTPRAVLIAWLVIGYEQQPLYIFRVAEVLTVRLSPEAAEAMGVPASFQQVPFLDMVRRVERVMERVIGTFDYKPFYKQGTKAEPGVGRRRRATREQVAEILADRAARAEELEGKRRRMFRFANDLLHTQYDALPPEARTHALSLSIDATFLEAPSRALSKRRMDNGQPTQKMALDPDAGLYIRTYEQRRDWDGTVDKALRKRGYGYEAELAVLVSNDPNHREAVPHIIVGFNFHRPNASAGQNAREIVEDIAAWGHGLGFFNADMAYLPGARPEDLQEYLRDNGAMVTMRYPVPEHRSLVGEGKVQAEAHGAHLIEGTWTCPVMPHTHRQINIAYREAVEADKANEKLTDNDRKQRELAYRALRHTRMEQRNKWELRLKERKDGKAVYGCPAQGADRSLDCPLKPNQPPTRPGVVPLPVTKTPKAPGKICTNKSSVTIDDEVGIRYAQHFRYGSPEWDHTHTYGRQTVESYNKSLKRADNSLHDSTNRRLQGEAEQAFLTVIAVAAENQRRIFAWMEDEFDPSRPAQEPRRRLTRTDRHTTVQRTSRGRGLPAARRARWGIAP